MFHACVCDIMCTYTILSNQTHGPGQLPEYSSTGSPASRFGNRTSTVALSSLSSPHYAITAANLSPAALEFVPHKSSLATSVTVTPNPSQAAVIYQTPPQAAPVQMTSPVSTTAATTTIIPNTSSSVPDLPTLPTNTSQQSAPPPRIHPQPQRNKIRRIQNKNLPATNIEYAEN